MTLTDVILASLPDMYKPLVITLENCGKEITTDVVITKLLQEADKATSKQVDAESAHVLKGNGPKKRFKGMQHVPQSRP